MKKSNRTLTLIVTLLLGVAFVNLQAQETKTDTIHLHTKKVVGDKTVEWDTVIVVTDHNEADINKYLRTKDGHAVILIDRNSKSKIHTKSMHLDGKTIEMHVSGELDKDGKSKVLTYYIKGDKVQAKDQFKVIKD